jgi:polyhydroxybutyrate depolymerase
MGLRVTGSISRNLLVALLALAGLVSLGLGMEAADGATARRAKPHRATAHPAMAHGATAGTAGLQSFSLKSDGLTRTYLLYVPPGDSAEHRLPLALVFSGAYTTAAEQAQTTNLLSLVEREHNMIVAIPQGYGDSWNDDDGDPPAEAANVNDVAFAQALLQTIESRYQVAMRRVVATGASNGAILTELLGCRIAANLTLIVPVEGQIAPNFSGNCRPSDPISVYEYHAFGDPAIPYKGGTIGGDGGPFSVLSAPASARRWATLDHCRMKPAQSKYTTGIGGQLTRYTGCNGAATVTLNSTNANVHAWPDGFGTSFIRMVTSLSTKRRARMP